MNDLQSGNYVQRNIKNSLVLNEIAANLYQFHPQKFDHICQQIINGNCFLFNRWWLPSKSKELKKRRIIAHHYLQRNRNENHDEKYTNNIIKKMEKTKKRTRLEMETCDISMQTVDNHFWEIPKCKKIKLDHKLMNNCPSSLVVNNGNGGYFSSKFYDKHCFGVQQQTNNNNNGNNTWVNDEMFCSPLQAMENNRNKQMLVRNNEVMVNGNDDCAMHLSF